MCGVWKGGGGGGGQWGQRCVNRRCGTDGGVSEGLGVLHVLLVLVDSPHWTLLYYKDIYNEDI